MQNRLQNRLNSLFQDYTHREVGDDSMAGAFAPPVDIYEDEEKIVLKLEAPGMKQGDFDVQIENNTLSVRGKRKFEGENKAQNYHRVERRYGSLYRAFILPQTVNTDQVQASYDAGILCVEFAKHVEDRTNAGGVAAVIQAAQDHEPAHRLVQLGLTPSEVGSALLPEMLLDVVQHASQVFGDVERALRWLRSAKPRLQGHTPLQESATKAGCRRVEEMLVQMEEGMVV